MEERDALFAVAEFGVGLAGFSAIVVALVRRSGGWEAASAYRLELLLFQSLGAGLFAFLPVTISFLGVQGPAVWRIASALFVVFLALCFLADWRRFHRLPDEARAVLSRGLVLVGNVQGAFFAVLLLPNIAGFPFRPQIGPYFLVLVCLLGTAALNFMRIVVTRPSE